MSTETELPTVSVVIVSYNVRRHLLATLRALLASQGPTLEVIVVDNASSDGSAEAVVKEFPQVRMIRQAKNVGFGAANNVALRECRGLQVLLLNPDVIVEPTAIRELSEFLTAHPEAGGVGPRLVLTNGRPDRAARRAFPTPWVAAMRFSGLSRLFPRSPHVARYNLGYISADTVHEIDSGSGACLLLQRSALDEVQFFDTDYFLYGEDLDLCFRLRASGWKTYYLPSAVATHARGASASQTPQRSIYEFHNSMWLFYTKHYAASLPGALHSLIWTAIWTRWLLMTVRAFVVLRLQMLTVAEPTPVESRLEEVADA